MTPIDCINAVSAPTWYALLYCTAGHGHQWAPTSITIRKGCSPDIGGATMTGSRLRRYACVICGAVEDRPEAP